jgi:hypothetical protein
MRGTIAPSLRGREIPTLQPADAGCEDLDRLALGEGDDGLLPLAGLALLHADALGLGLDVDGVDLDHVDAEELLDSARISSLAAVRATSKVYLPCSIRS